MIDSREKLKEYALMQLGAPVVEINVDDGQVDNQVDNALDYFAEFHGLGTEKTYLKHRATATTITTNSSAGFIDQEIAVTTSGIQVRIHDTPNATTIRVVTQGIMLPSLGDTLTGLQSGAVATINAIVYGDIDLGYIPTSNLVENVVKVFPMTASIYGSGIFDIRYQLRLNDLFDLYSTEMIYYTNVQQHLSLIEHLLVTDKQFRFNKLTNRLYIDMDWKKTISPDEFIIAEAFIVTDPDTYNRVWNDRMLKKLTTAYVKRQWGNNMKKYSSISIIGGLTMNGQQVFDEAEDEIEKIEAEIRDTYSVPPLFFMA